MVTPTKPKQASDDHGIVGMLETARRVVAAHKEKKLTFAAKCGDDDNDEDDEDGDDDDETDDECNPMSQVKKRPASAMTVMARPVQPRHDSSAIGVSSSAAAVGGRATIGSAASSSSTAPRSSASVGIPPPSMKPTSYNGGKIYYSKAQFKFRVYKVAGDRIEAGRVRVDFKDPKQTRVAWKKALAIIDGPPRS